MMKGRPLRYWWLTAACVRTLVRKSGHTPNPNIQVHELLKTLMTEAVLSMETRITLYQLANIFSFFPPMCVMCVFEISGWMLLLLFFVFLNLLFIEYIGNLWTLRCRDLINRSMRMGGEKPYLIKSPNLAIKMLFLYISFTQAYYDILHVCTTHCIPSFTSEPWSFNLTFTLWSGGARRELGGAGEKWKMSVQKRLPGSNLRMFSHMYYLGAYNWTLLGFCCWISSFVQMSSQYLAQLLGLQSYISRKFILWWEHDSSSIWPDYQVCFAFCSRVHKL